MCAILLCVSYFRIVVASIVAVVTSSVAAVPTAAVVVVVVNKALCFVKYSKKSYPNIYKL